MKKILLGFVILCVMAGNVLAADAAITILKRESWGSSRVVYGYITFDETVYSSTGLSITARNLGLDNIKNVVVSDVSSPVYGWYYDYTNSTVRLFLSETNAFEPAASPATSDIFTVTDDNSAASNGKLIFVTAFGGASGGVLGFLDSMGGSSVDLLVSVIGASDSATTLVLSDTLSCPAGIRVSVCGGDTLYFDEDATNTHERLMYSGNSLGSLGYIYIPFDHGNYIKVLEKTDATIYAAGAVPLYFDEDAGLDDKVLAVTVGNANSTFTVDPYYTSLVLYNPATTEEVAENATISATVRFIAIGN